MRREQSRKGAESPWLTSSVTWLTETRMPRAKLCQISSDLLQKEGKKSSHCAGEGLGDGHTDLGQGRTDDLKRDEKAEDVERKQKG